MPYDICDNDPRVLESPVSDWIERLACNPEPISLTPTRSVSLEPLAYRHDPATGYPQDLLLDPEFGSYRTNVWQVEEPSGAGVLQVSAPSGFGQSILEENNEISSCNQYDQVLPLPSHMYPYNGAFFKCSLLGAGGVLAPSCEPGHCTTGSSHNGGVQRVTQSEVMGPSPPYESAPVTDSDNFTIGLSIQGRQNMLDGSDGRGWNIQEVSADPLGMKTRDSGKGRPKYYLCNICKQNLLVHNRTQHMETHRKPLEERKHFACAHVGCKAGPWTRKNDLTRHEEKKHQHIDAYSSHAAAD
ncbi:hypothetical protein ONZ51_g9208 [Trametes cubensis]|uniref:C2H2-type domain-containing protein n=1 Tax=Trametes cubensis TaxID=1111947 RepID=A0AAD7TNM7_9APHY|nr:hypothetical protein ONZ51_g9208 [Trametes cubensis]